MKLADLRYAVRILLKNPLFSLVIVLTLALGIGANTAMFSLVNAVLLRPFGYPEPDRLVSMVPTRNGENFSLSLPDYREWRKRAEGFASVAAYEYDSFNLFARDVPQRARGLRCAASLFPTLGIRPALGRSFVDENEVYGRNRVVVISHALWQSRFGGAPDALGQQLRLNGQLYEVIGVMSSGLSFPTPDVELWVPLSYPPDSPMLRRGNYYLTGLGRLKPGVTVSQASQALDALTRRIDEEEKIGLKLGAHVQDLRQSEVGPVKTSLLVILGAVGLVVLIACVNIANLLLARGTARRRELAVRAALGASRTRLVGMLIAESLLLSAAGGIVGTWVAIWGLDWVRRLTPADVPHASEVTADWRVLAFAFALSLVTGLLFGWLPALRITKAGGADDLADGSRGGSAGRSHQRLRSTLVVAEVALSLVLLTGAGLLLRSLGHLATVDPGFRPDNVLTALIPLPDSKYREASQILPFVDRLLTGVAAVPGVQSVSLGTSLPLSESSWTKMVWPLDRGSATSLDQVPIFKYRQVTPDYFRTMGIALRRGRLVQEADQAKTLPVGVINEALAKRFWPNGDPIGKNVRLGPPDNLIPPGVLPPGYKMPEVQIVGLVADVRSDRLDQPAAYELFVPITQAREETSTNLYVAVRTSEDPLRWAPALRSVVSGIDREQPLASVMPMTQRVADSLAQPRFRTILLGSFALLAILLTVVGVYGVVSYTVAQRTREFGIRLALGAPAAEVLGGVLRHGLWLGLWGAVLGLAGALAVTRLLSSLLYQVSPFDPPVFAAASALLVVVVVSASLVPALRAARISPLDALRAE
jgi:putative ABC transport system permease protein